jgi:hypothetical protein
VVSAVRHASSSASRELVLPTVKHSFIAAAFAIAILSVAQASATGRGDKPASAQPSARVPDRVSGRLFAAKTVFISALPLSKSSRYSQDDATRDFAAGQVAKTVLSWRIYGLAPNATSADLIFEVFAKEPDIRLVVRDPKSSAEIWTFSRSGKKARLSQNAHANFNRAVYELLDDVRRVAGPPAASDKTPSSIGAVPRVFLSSTGNAYEMGRFTFDWPALPYNMLYAALQNTGRFQLVMAPAQAELIFEIHYADPERNIYIGTSDGSATPEYEDYDSPQIKLVVWNSATRAVLLVTTEYVGNDSFEQAIASLVDKVEAALGQPAATVTEAAKPKSKAKPKARMVKDAPLPAQLGSAKRVLVVPPPGVEIYDQLCAAIKRWGRYELVANAGNTDLVIEIQHDIVDRFVIVDPQTQVPLWELSVSLYHVRAQVAGPSYSDFLARAARNGNSVAAIVYGLSRLVPKRQAAPTAPINMPEKNAKTLAEAFQQLDARIAGLTTPDPEKKDATQERTKQPARLD